MNENEAMATESIPDFGGRKSSEVVDESEMEVIWRAYKGNGGSLTFLEIEQAFNLRVSKGTTAWRIIKRYDAMHGREHVPTRHHGKPTGEEQEEREVPPPPTAVVLAPVPVEEPEPLPPPPPPPPCTVIPYFQRYEIRKAVREKIKGHGWQLQETPEWLAKEMVGQVKDSPELLYCVLFNIEFVEELVFARGIPRERVMFMADSRVEAVVATGMYGVKALRTRKELGPERTIRRVLRKAVKAFGEDKVMPKASNLVVFGNPPYQSEDGGHGKSAKPIYHLFVESIIDNLNPRYLSLVTPSRWMVGGKGLDNYRDRLMKDRRLRMIRHFSGWHDVFSDVCIAGGTSYFLWDREHDGKCNFNGMHRFLNEYDIVVSDNKAVSILDKVKASRLDYLNERCLPRKPYGLSGNFKGWKDSGVPCYTVRREKKYVDPSAFEDVGRTKDRWKACIARFTNEGGSFEGDLRLVLKKPFVIESGSICTETYLVVNSFESQVEADNFISYMKTKFFRFMLGLHVVTQDISKEKFAFVPDLGDYSKPWTDEELYKMVDLSEDEIRHIESKIKPMA